MEDGRLTDTIQDRLSKVSANEDDGTVLEQA